MTSLDVCVVIPFFNSSATLRRALESVAAQTAGAPDVIVVDDASSAAERESAAGIIRDFENVDFISLKVNGGPANARNEGWKRARTTWIAFLDGDDAWHPDKLARQLSVVGGSAHIGIVSTGYHHVSVAGGGAADASVASGPVQVIRKRDLLLRNRFATSSVMLRREIGHRFPTGRRYSEDYELWLLIAGDGHMMRRIDDALTFSFAPRLGGSGLSSKVWRMIAGEYRALVGARSAGALRNHEFVVAMLASTVRSSVRLPRIALSRLLQTK